MKMFKLEVFYDGVKVFINYYRTITELINYIDYNLNYDIIHNYDLKIRYRISILTELN